MFARERPRKPTWLAIVLMLAIISGACVLWSQREEALRKEAIHKAVIARIDADKKLGFCASKYVHKHTEYFGSVVVQARNATGRIHTAASAQECCQKCQARKGCNEWVWCHEPEKCGQECWLKREGSHAKAPQPGNNPSVIWTSGLIPKDFDVDPATLPPLDKGIKQVQLNTQYGKIRITLKPDWSETSVEFVQRLAQQPELCSPDCQFYRAEPGFLLQGSLAAYIPPNQVKKEGPKIMERGEIGWAGGEAGPHFFIYVGKDPGKHWGTSHTVWGILADEDSMKVVERILELPTSSSKPGGMKMMNTRLDITPGRVSK